MYKSLILNTVVNFYKCFDFQHECVSAQLHYLINKHTLYAQEHQPTGKLDCVWTDSKPVGQTLFVVIYSL